MDPIKTAVKYALIPLRIAVQLGELVVGEDEAPQPDRKPARKAASPPRPKPAPRAKPQASKAPKPLGDPNIARKVETVIFRDPAVPQGQIDVNVVDAVVWLRGEALHPEMIVALEAQAAAIPEVVGVENLLHLPKTPAPTRTDVFDRERKTRETKPRSSIVQDRPIQHPITNERKNQPGEPSPRELARERKGRQPAPLGAAERPQDSS
jgi:hypothetical protein